MIAHEVIEWLPTTLVVQKEQSVGCVLRVYVRTRNMRTFDLDNWNSVHLETVEIKFERQSQSSTSQ